MSERNASTGGYVSWLNRSRETTNHDSSMPFATRIPVSDIPIVPDEILRAALERQVEARSKKLGSRIVVVAYWPDGGYSHSLMVPSRSLIEYAAQAHA